MDSQSHVIQWVDENIVCIKATCDTIIDYRLVSQTLFKAVNFERSNNKGVFSQSTSLLLDLCLIKNDVYTDSLHLIYK